MDVMLFVLAMIGVAMLGAWLLRQRPTVSRGDYLLAWGFVVGGLVAAIVANASGRVIVGRIAFAGVVLAAGFLLAALKRQRNTPRTS